MTFTKLFKVTLVIIGVYLVTSLALNLYSLYYSVNNRYATQKYDYEHAKLCYECANGLKTGICPKINQNPSLSGYADGMNPVYPKAQEYSGDVKHSELSTKQTYNQLNSNEINDDFIVTHDYCYYRDWTAENNHIGLFSKEPDKGELYFESLKNPGIYYSILVGPLYLLACSAGGCQP